MDFYGVSSKDTTTTWGAGAYTDMINMAQAVINCELPLLYKYLDNGKLPEMGRYISTCGNESQTVAYHNSVEVMVNFLSSITEMFLKNKTAEVLPILLFSEKSSKTQKSLFEEVLETLDKYEEYEDYTFKLGWEYSNDHKACNRYVKDCRELLKKHYKN